MMFLCSLSLFIIMIVHNHVLFSINAALLWFVYVFTESCVSQSISPLEEKVDTVEGQTVTLSCRYEGSVYNLYWYRQYPGSRPEFLLMKGPGSAAVIPADPPFPRLDAADSNNTVNLIISSAAVSDSTLYYCALTPTVTGNPDTLYRNPSLLYSSFQLYHVFFPPTYGAARGAASYSSSCSHTQLPRSSLTITTSQVRSELRKIKTRKAAGPDGISSRLLMSCAKELCSVAGHILNLSLRLGRVPQRWKTSCVVPVPKTPHPKDLNSYRPVALTSHLMKTLERLLLVHICPLVSPALDPLQFAYQPGIGVEDAIIHLLHRPLSHLENAGSTLRIMFFDFSSAFNTIQPMLL
ncbi:hypothetical protein NFI96_028900 [Prochilodus magdalenae]|nr:hypothetical protein NFI96_028900 [Prochilodus magdalenae]